MTLTVSDQTGALIQRLIESGRFRDAPAVVDAGLRKLEEDHPVLKLVESFPPGSLARHYTNQSNAEELSLLKGCSLAIEDE